MASKVISLIQAVTDPSSPVGKAMFRDLHDKVSLHKVCFICAGFHRATFSGGHECLNYDDERVNICDKCASLWVHHCHRSNCVNCVGRLKVD